MSQPTLAPGHELLSNPQLAETGDSEWDRRFAAYVVRKSLTIGETSFGAFARADEAHRLEAVRIHELFGGKSGDQEPEALRSASSANMAAAERAFVREYCEPMWRAAADLVLTPAPNLVAALFKVALIQVEDLDNDGYTNRDAMEIVLEDVARLGASINANFLPAISAAAA